MAINFLKMLSRRIFVDSESCYHPGRQPPWGKYLVEWRLEVTPATFQVKRKLSLEDKNENDWLTRSRPGSGILSVRS